MLRAHNRILCAHTNSYDYWNISLDDKLPFRNITYASSGKLEIE